MQVQGVIAVEGAPVGNPEDCAVFSREDVASLASDKITVEERDGRLCAMLRTEATPEIVAEMHRPYQPVSISFRRAS